MPDVRPLAGVINLPIISPLESDSRGVFHGDVLNTNASSGEVESVFNSPRAANEELSLPLMKR